MKKIRQAAAVVMTGIFLVTAAGCQTADTAQGESGQTANTVQGESGQTADAESSGETGQTVDQSVIEAAAEEAESIDDSWSEDEVDSVVTLEGDTAEESGSGVQIDGNTVTVVKGGTYLFRGTLNGQIVVNTDKKTEVRLILDGVTITCEDSAPIDGILAQTITVTLAEDSENVLTDGTEYVYDNASKEEPNAALYAKNNLVINGNGSLTVNANCNYGINAKDSLILAGGTVTVNSVGDGIRGKDSVIILGGTYNVTSQSDGIQSFNDEDDDCGWIYVADGTFVIDAQEDGFQAETLLLTEGGSYQVTTGGGSENGRIHNEEMGGMPGNGGVPENGGTGGNDGAPGNGAPGNGAPGGNGGVPENGAATGHGGGPGNRDTNSSGEERETPPDMEDGTFADGETMPDMGDMTPPDMEDGTFADGETPPDMGDMTPPGQNDGNSDSGSNAYESDDDTLDDADDVTDSVSRKGLKAGLLLSISGGTYELNCADDSLHSNGDLTVSGGAFTMATGDDGAHADGTLTVSGGEMEITTCYEGLEGTEIDVTGGSVTLTASDDGINAAGDAGAVLVSVSGGILQINASGDGLDSNGDIVMTGGEVYVSGPTGDGNGSLDYSGECRIDGGLLFLAGSTGMLQNPGEDSGQNTITVVYSEQQEAGTEVSLRTADEAVIASFTPAKAYASIQVSAPELDDGTVVSLYSGEEKLGEITVSGSVTVADETGAETSVRTMGGMDGR